MIDLAPNHKIGLSVPNPILLAGGTVGYGEAAHKAIQPQLLGGVVIGPITHHSRTGVSSSRLAETHGGMVLNTGLQNRGVSAVIKRFSSLWPKLGCPVIAQVADSEPHAVEKVVQHLERVASIDGLELLPPRDVGTHQLTTLIHAASRQSDLPIWVKLPLLESVRLAEVAAEAGVSAFVIGQPNIGAGFHQKFNKVITGKLFGPSTFPSMLAELAAIATEKLPCALIACGGIHTIDQVHQALRCGAHAVQIDSVAWIEPGLPAHLVQGLTKATL